MLRAVGLQKHRFIDHWRVTPSKHPIVLHRLFYSAAVTETVLEQITILCTFCITHLSHRPLFMLLLVKFVILNYDSFVIKFIAIVKRVVSSLNSCKLFLAIDI